MAPFHICIHLVDIVVFNLPIDGRGYKDYNCLRPSYLCNNELEWYNTSSIIRVGRTISVIIGLDRALARPTEWTSVTVKWFWDCCLPGRYNHGVDNTASTWHVNGCSVFGLLFWCPKLKSSDSFEDRASQIKPVQKCACLFDNLFMLITEKTTKLNISGDRWIAYTKVQ